jgi:hypothetical protein
MDAATRSEMLKLAEGKSDGSATIELSVDELFNCVDSALYPPSNGLMGSYSRGSSGKALAALEGLGKLGYDKRDLDNLKKYFEHCAEAEELRNDASRALGRMREEYYDDKDKKNGGSGGKMMAKAY